MLGVSRHTISNWENEKSYPDIISVIKMSECYDVSLDYLLKGEQKMKNYYDYLEESTNVVKSNTNRNKIITILSYLLIWAFAMIVFWLFTNGSDAMCYSLMFLWSILPVTTFIVSVVIGKITSGRKGNGHLLFSLVQCICLLNMAHLKWQTTLLLTSLILQI